MVWQEAHTDTAQEQQFEHATRDRFNKGTSVRQPVRHTRGSSSEKKVCDAFVSHDRDRR